MLVPGVSLLAGFLVNRELRKGQIILVDTCHKDIQIIDLTLGRFEIGTEWITEGLRSGSDALVVPTTEHVGDLANFWRNNAATGVTANGENGRFGLDLATATGTPFLITRVLDVNKRDIIESGNTGVFVVFRPLGSNTV